jgi:hypothetical protein
MIPKKPAPDMIRGCQTFSGKIMRKGKKSMILSLKIGPP